VLLRPSIFVFIIAALTFFMKPTSNSMGTKINILTIFKKKRKYSIVFLSLFLLVFFLYFLN
jgi:hypothetical protein